MDAKQYAFLAEPIRESAAKLRQEADHLDRLATRLVEHSDLGYISEAIGVLTRIPESCRLDVIVSRFIRNK